MSESNSSKVFIKTFGCQMNEYDSSKMADVLKVSHGYEVTTDIEAADLVLLNTCSVREKASEKVFSDLGRLREWKAAKPGRLVGVGGCVASQEGEAIAKRAPNVDLVFGPQTLHRLPQMLDETRRTQRPAIDVRFPEIEKFDNLPEPRAEGPSAFVSIMEGCSKYCTFCIVPYTRGEEISRPLDDVLAEVDALLAQGVREITLLGQNVNAYAGPMAGGGSCDLALLIHILARFESLGRIRYTTSHPAHFTDALIDAYGSEPKLAAVLHLPVQSGSDRILAMMKRGYTKAQYLEKIRRLRALKPNISLSTDFIVGFPSETEEDFEATMDLIEQARIDAAYSFVYSPRPGTPAANLRDGVPAEVKQARLDRLQARVREIGDEYATSLIGSTQRVLVEGPSRRGNGQLTGKTPCNRSINFDGEARLIGQFVDLRVTHSLTNSLRGEAVIAG
ncbi:MAG: tRNA (N6-isopentenyl adenosine(37)-C2)-methylthiotransferase MiaB [Nevskia sp.]|jgi:tRNA-2-methylthio-N6-dimethylallyladenosine synthase|nr:tRNA (N6-isopentenyl adenosine(37)-C2)-methylthiotransferase MiaB [Nevskia sp.]